MARRSTSVGTLIWVLALCITTGEGIMTLSLKGDNSIPTDGSGRILITDVGFSWADSLICDSDQVTSSASSNWYLNPMSESTASQDRLLNSDPRGWTRMRDSANGVIRLRRYVTNPMEGVFTCHIMEDPMSPISIGIYYTSSQTPPSAPTGVIVSDVKPHSVRVSWIPQPNVTRYIVDYEQVMGTGQLGLCSDAHSGSVTTADSIANVIVEGIDGSGDFRLRAFTTYSITVTAVREGGDHSNPSEVASFTTAQTAANVPPDVVDVTAQSPTSIVVQWDPIPHCPDINGNIIGYSVSYLALPNGKVKRELVPGTWNVGGQVTLSRLTPFTVYSIQVAAVNSQSDVGVYSDPVSRQTHEDTPGPVVISMSKTAFQTTISWSPPEMPNGIIIAYEVSYLQRDNPQNVTHMNTTNQVTRLSVCGLRPETQYIFTVRAYTKAGAGEYSTVMHTTSDRPDVIFQLRLNGIFNCQEWVDNGSMEKLMDISSALSQVIQDSCQCRYGQSEIDGEVFHCFKTSQSSVTYRARLLATDDVGTQSLTSYLKEWVAGGNSIVVQGVILNVDEDCSVEIADILQQEEGCSKGTTRSDITGVAVAVGVGGTVLLAFTVTFAVIVFMWKRRSHSTHQDIRTDTNPAHTNTLRSEVAFPFSDILHHNSAYGQRELLEESVFKCSTDSLSSSEIPEPIYEVVYDN